MLGDNYELDTVRDPAAGAVDVDLSVTSVAVPIVGSTS